MAMAQLAARWTQSGSKPKEFYALVMQVCTC
jgi:hypothetical protein